jgi:DNA-binding CsgD family transcriptional regulator
MASIAADMAGDRASARRLRDEAQAVASGIDDVGAALAVLQARAFGGLFEGDLGAVRSAASEGVVLSREVGDLYGLKTWLMHLGMADFMAGDLGTSKPMFAEALRIARQIDDRVQQSYLLDALGCHAARSGHARLAAQLLGAADTSRIGAGASVMPFLAPLVGQAEQASIADLGAPRFEAESTVGRRLSRDAAIRLALGESARVGVAARDGGGGDALLSMREAEVARLVAEGMTNKEIGSRLFISEHTVDSHIRSILNKLGVNSRAQIAAWMASPNQ